MPLGSSPQGVSVSQPPAVLGRAPDLWVPINRVRLILLKVSQPLGTLMFMARILFFLFSLLTSTLRSRLSLQLEIAALRHQLSTYRLKGQIPRITLPDRLLWSILAKLWSQWRGALFFVQPRTVTVWQRKRFRDYWCVFRRNSATDSGVNRPPNPVESGH